MTITYTPITDFSAKDDMVSTNPGKILSGVPFDTEFSAISAAFQLAAPSLNPSFTGTASFADVTVAGTTTVGALTATTVNGTDTSTWDATSSTVSSKEAGWDATKATVDADAAGWDATEATVNAGATNWDEAYGWGDHAAAGYTSTDTTYTGGTNITLDGTTFNLDASLTGLTDVTTSVVSIGSWEIKLDGSDIRFCYGGVDKMRLTTGGALITSGDITASGSP